jgi:hypothetical protein
MINSRIAVIAALAACASVAQIAPAAAQVRTFVSGHGADTGTCGLGAPCRTFAYAITQTNAGGEITVLDPAGYGILTINKALGIINDGVGEAGVTVTTPADAITVAAGASDVIILRGLTLVGGGAGANGITFDSGKTLIVQKSSIRGFTNFGINFLSLTNPSSLVVTDSEIVSNGNGVLFEPNASASTGISAVVAHSVLAANTTVGFEMNGAAGSSGALYATLADNVIAENGGDGVFVTTPNAHPFVHAMLRNDTIVNNRASGIEINNGNDAQSGGTVYLTRSTITGNNLGITNPNGRLFSYFDNNIDDDISGGDTAPVTTPYK